MMSLQFVGTGDLVGAFQKMLFRENYDSQQSQAKTQVSYCGVSLVPLQYLRNQPATGPMCRTQRRANAALANASQCMLQTSAFDGTWQPQRRVEQECSDVPQFEQIAFRETRRLATKILFSQRGSKPKHHELGCGAPVGSTNSGPGPPPRTAGSKPSPT